MLTNHELVANGPLLRDPGCEPTGHLIGNLAVTPRTGAVDESVAILKSQI